jgi:hypothetical protein
MTIFGITIPASDLWLLGACGALVLVFVKLRFTAELRDRDIFNNAAKEFTDTFHNELKGIYPIQANWPNNIDHYLRARFDNLQEAVGKFKNHLPRRRRKSLDEAWFRFYCCTGREVDRNCQCYHHYMPFSGVSVVDGEETIHDNTKTYKQDFKKNVDALLKFAKQK